MRLILILWIISAVLLIRVSSHASGKLHVAVRVRVEKNSIKSLHEYKQPVPTPVTNNNNNLQDQETVTCDVPALPDNNDDEDGDDEMSASFSLDSYRSSRCARYGGYCTSGCSGHTIRGLCPGSWHIRCCIAGSRRRRTSSYRRRDSSDSSESSSSSSPSQSEFSGSQQSAQESPGSQSSPSRSFASSSCSVDKSRCAGGSQTSISVPVNSFSGSRSSMRVQVHRCIANEIQQIFTEIAGTGFKIHSLGGYACRGNTSNRSVLSNHAFGLAVDINSEENPYIRGAQIVGSRAYLNRAAVAGRAGVITNNSPVVAIFTRHGFRWGGNYRGLKDYMHFEKLV